MRRSAVSDLVLHCLLMSHKKETRLIWVNYMTLKLFVIAYIGVKCSDFAMYMRIQYGHHYKTLPKIVDHWWFIDSNARHYITPMLGVMQ